MLASRFGRIIVGIRENERRAELLGYDPRAYKLATFTIGAALAGYAGCLFANWGAFVSPTIFGLAQSAQIIIWVIVGGRGTLIGPILGCVGIQWLTAALGANAPTGSRRLGLACSATRRSSSARSSQPVRADRPQRVWCRRSQISAFGFRDPTARGRDAMTRAARRDPQGLGMRFGGVQAVRDVNFTARGTGASLSDRSKRRRQEHLLQAADRPAAANLGPSSVSRRGYFAQAEPHEIARRGIGIKTQAPSVFEGLSCPRKSMACRRRGSPKRGREARAGSSRRCWSGSTLVAIASRVVGQLAHGQRQWVELGVVLSTDPDLVLLDEPAAGMTDQEALAHRRSRARDQQNESAYRRRA